MLDTNFLSGGNKGDGRNLFVMGDSEPGYLNTNGTINTGNLNGEATSEYIPVSSGETFTSQVWMTVPEKTNSGYYWLIYFGWYSEKSEETFIKLDAFHGGDQIGFYHEDATATAPDSAKYLRVSVRLYVDGKVKLERGSIATDWTPAPEDVVTKTPPDIFEALDSIPEMHRNIFRGKNLGTVFTDEQKAAIKAGTFHDLWVGDYWTISNHTWRIVDINYWMNKGDTACTTPHIVVMPDGRLYTGKMNNTDTTDTGYQGSLMYTKGLTEAKSIVNTDFGETYILNHRSLLTNAASGGHASGGNWQNSTVELANEIMIYGSYIFMTMNNGTTIPYLCTSDTTQLALFRLVPRFINISRQWYWLRDVVSEENFAYMANNGGANNAKASGEYGVRPVFGITGGAVAADEPDDDLEVTELSGKGGEPL